MVLDKRLVLFLSLSATFITALIVGDLIGSKLFEIRLGGTSFVITVGMLPFPITFVITDLLNEFYGQKAARTVTIVGFFMACFTLLVTFVAIQVPWAPFTRDATWAGVNQASFDRVFGGSYRILGASIVAYLVAQFLDIGVFHLLKNKTEGRFLWLRATGSTVVSQLVDTVVIQSLAWWGLLSFRQIGSIVVTSYLVKLVIAIGLTPVIYAGHALVERVLGLEPAPASS